MKKIEQLALIDDDDTFIFITKKIIEKTERVEEVKVFSNGLDALNYFEEKLNIDFKLPDVIFLDLSMPIMDGWQFLDAFTALKFPNRKNTIIYICSSSISPHDFLRAKKISAVTDYIIKPFTKEKLTEIILAL